MNRKTLFNIQAIISMFMMAVTLFVYGSRTVADPVLKVIASPFAGLSVGIFALFLFALTITNYNEEKPYPLKQMVGSLLLLVLGTLVIQFGIHQLLQFGDSLAKLVFVYSLLICIVVFVYIRIRNLWSMAILTAVCEAFVIYLVFLAN